MTAVDVNVGASFVFVTSMLNEAKLVVSEPSLTVMTMLLYVPTSPFAGVPVNAPVEELNDNQLGTVVPVSVTESLGSMSFVVTVYEYAMSSVADVTAVDV